MGPVEDRAEVAELGGQALDQAPHEPLARQTGEHDRRRPPLRRDQVHGQAPEGGDPEVGHGSEAPDDEVADAGAHRGRADDHGDGRERVAALELEDPLAERVLELRETAADEQPLVCVIPAGHGRGERITRPGRVGRPAGPRGRGAGGLRSARGRFRSARGRSPRARGARRGVRRGRPARSRRSRSPGVTTQLTSAQARSAGRCRPPTRRAPCQLPAGTSACGSQSSPCEGPAGDSIVAGWSGSRPRTASSRSPSTRRSSAPSGAMVTNSSGRPPWYTQSSSLDRRWSRLTDSAVTRKRMAVEAGRSPRGVRSVCAARYVSR